ncbi:MAG: rhodanese-like domain-containing protein [Flavobacterium sp.]
MVDVRTYVEFDEGHIEGVKNIDYLADDFEAQMSKLDRDKPIYIYCASGGRSEVTASMLHELGFKNINDLSGGYIAWKKLQ